MCNALYRHQEETTTQLLQGETELSETVDNLCETDMCGIFHLHSQNDMAGFGSESPPPCFSSRALF